MIILSGKNIKKTYGINLIIEDATFTVQENDKIGVVGVNGAGKSTLFKILNGEISKDDGEIYIGKEISIGYMSQDFDFQSENTMWDEMLSVFSHVIKIEQDIKTLEDEISRLSLSADHIDEVEQLLKTYAHLQDRYKDANGFGFQSYIKGVLKGLGFNPEDFNKKISALSGGQKTRVALGKILLQNHNVLLLDEPTNYLDIEAVEWLEEFLKNYKGALLIISHDRYFLDMVTNRTFEIENGKLKEYDGNYTKYIEKKEENREQLLKDYALQQKEIARQEAIIARFRQYNREKSIRQAESREKALERMEKIDKPENLPKSARIAFQTKFRSGNDVLLIENLSKSFEKNLFQNVSFKINRGERVALLGPNGIGKTTLLKIIAGKLNADSGRIKQGNNVFIGYYEQEHEHLNMNKMVIDEVWDEYPELNQTELRTKLAAFLFEGEEVFKEIYKLSGGERSRISLLKLMLSKSNFLLMDEPTNHLDIMSKEVLENALVNYDGTVLLVSHDRYFLNKVATKIIELTPSGCIVYPGNYSYYMDKKNKLLEEQNTDGDKQKPENSEVKNDWLKQKEEKARERKNQKRIENIEKEIEIAENRLAEIDTLMHQREIFTDHIKCQELHEESEELKRHIDLLYNEWNQLMENI